jgi:hypothetical protein
VSFGVSGNARACKGNTPKRGDRQTDIAKLDGKTHHGDDRTKERRKQETVLRPHYVTTTHKLGLKRQMKNTSIVFKGVNTSLPPPSLPPHQKRMKWNVFGNFTRIKRFFDSKSWSNTEKQRKCVLGLKEEQKQDKGTSSLVAVCGPKY